MARRGLIVGQEGAETSAWVKIPKGKVTGQDISCLLRSLDNQIHARHLDKVVTHFGVDGKERKIVIKFREDGG